MHHLCQNNDLNGNVKENKLDLMVFHIYTEMHQLNKLSLSSKLELPKILVNGILLKNGQLDLVFLGYWSQLFLSVLGVLAITFGGGSLQPSQAPKN